jgi:hypothetical protein
VKQIQKEMLMHGPLVTEFKCDDNFSIYSDGILIQANIPEQPVINETKKFLKILDNVD